MTSATNSFFNAHHSPVGAFASFTLGFPGASGGLGLELGKPADQDVFIALETDESHTFEALPFYSDHDNVDLSANDDRAHFDVEGGITTPKVGPRVLLRAFPGDAIRRDFAVGADTWTAGDLSFSIYSSVGAIPDSAAAGDDEDSIDNLRDTLLPAVLAEITVDNTRGTRTRRAVFGYSGKDPYAAMRHVGDNLPGHIGVGQGRSTAIVTDARGARSGIGFSFQAILEAHPIENLTFGLGACAVIITEVPPGETRTFHYAICFYRDGLVTSGIDVAYYYTRLFPNIEAVARYALRRFPALRGDAIDATGILEHNKLSDDQLFMLAHAIRAYYGSTQLLVRDGKPLWVVNEGEYRMMNTFDLTVDQMFYELKFSPWTVRNELDLFTSRYSYRDTVRFPGDLTNHPGGLSFTHDMGVANVFSRPGYSCYEQFALRGCFSHMTHEQLVNYVCCATVYIEQTGDSAWRDANLEVLVACLESMLNRDHPEPDQRDGIMSLDSSRTMGGAEITTYDSLDTSLGQARGNIYLAGKCWAAYVALERLFTETHFLDLAAVAATQADRCAATLVANVCADGHIPAVLGEGTDARIVPAIEGLIFPLYTGCPEALAPDGRFGALIAALRRHLETVLVPGVCLFPDGAWKLSSTANNSWLSKIYLCQFIARHILGIDGDQVSRAADAAHVAWLTDPRNGYWSWSDQMVHGVAIGSRYYPRGVTAILWLSEAHTTS